VERARANLKRPGARSRGFLTVAVVIPVKDDAPLLARCLRDLARQTRRADEVIVVDNASAGDSAAIAAAAGARVVVEPEPGIPAAAAAGYDAARSDVLVRCDADSRLPPDWLERLVERLDGVDAVTGPARFYDLPPRLRRFGGLFAGAYLGAYAIATGLALGHPPLFGSNFALRRSAWLEVRSAVHRTGTELHDDLDLSVHLGVRHRIRWDPRLVVGISSRPFRDRAALRRRFRRGMRTIRMHWPEEYPPYRWARRRSMRSRE
jgi:glycosyltransferase involved in cell wall biosynthesis